MKARTIVWICAVVAPAAILAQGPASQSKGAAKLMGAISDSVFGSPLVGAGVTVLEDNNFKFVKSTLTEAPGGTYQIDDLTAGKKYWVLFCKEKYVTEYSVVTVPTKVDKKLTLREADKVYWNGKAMMFIADFNVTGRADQKRFEKTWQEFQTSAVSAEGKAYVARDLKNQLHANPELWVNVKLFTAYADADPRKLGKAERAIWLNTNDPVVFSLDPIILLDMRTRKAEVQQVLVYKQASPADPCSNPYQ